jgi:hypothetical protein
MVDVYEMLRQKENDIVRVREEIQALRVVAPLLSDSQESEVLEPDQQLEGNTESGTAALALDTTVEENSPAQAEQSGDSLEFGQAIPPKRSRLRNLLGLAAGE